MVDKLIDRIKELKNPTVIGLDPTYEMIPDFLKEAALNCYGKTPKAVARMFLDFNMAIIDRIFDIIPAVKPQIAMYERYGIDGLTAYVETIQYAKSKGLIVIGDIKRGDIASTAEAYAAHIGGITIEGEFFDPWKEDFVTLNPYLGTDSMVPFLKYCKEREKGIFVLIKTSNPSSGELQDRLIDGKPLYWRTAELVDEWGASVMGARGYSRVGAVVGATHKEQGEALRKHFPHIFFLVPGYGAQGGTGSDLRGYFDENGVGIIVNSSRGLIAAYQKDKEFGDVRTVGIEFAEATRKAAIQMRMDLQLAMER
ncbi:MAG: orotidine-5'-phosphate decarboxylase [Anaerovoracaceae bacterium]|jgi:orotidine-5'-phosphate decarboxylase